MSYSVQGPQIQIDCNDRAHAETILQVFDNFKLHAELTFADDSGTLKASGGWDTITVLANQAEVSPVIAAAAIAGGIAAGELVKEAAKDTYKAVKAALWSCVAITRKKKSSPYEKTLGFRVSVFPLGNESNMPGRISLDFSFDNPSDRGKPIVVSDEAVAEAIWLFENKVAPILSAAHEAGFQQQMMLQIGPDGGIIRCQLGITFGIKRFVVTFSRDGVSLPDDLQELLQTSLQKS